MTLKENTSIFNINAHAQIGPSGIKAISLSALGYNSFLSYAIWKQLCKPHTMEQLIFQSFHIAQMHSECTVCLVVKNVYLHFTDWSDMSIVYVTSRKGAEIKGIQKYNVACFCKHSMIFITQM